MGGGDKEDMTEEEERVMWQEINRRRIQKGDDPMYDNMLTCCAGGRCN
jgi:hypothetical protein